MSYLATLPELEPWILELSLTAEKEKRNQILAQHSHVDPRLLFEILYQGVIALVKVDLQQAERVADTAAGLAQKLDDPFINAKCARAQGTVTSLRGHYPEAIRKHEESIAGFEKLGADFEAAVTINNALLTFAYDGQHEKAYELAEKARKVFLARGDAVRLARLDANVANIYYRQDRLHEAMELYERAYREFLKHDSAVDISVLLRNMSVCYISLNELGRAEETYKQARQFFEAHGFSLILAYADYNIAYLHYLRGEYLRAIELYDQTRELSKRLGDKYHQALCDLDESEIYLELNLTEGGEELAKSAFNSFQELGITYEAAKAATFFAIAASKQGQHKRALGIFDQARELFVRENNDLWPALIDLYKALVLYDAEDDDQAYDLAAGALKYFADSPLSGKAAICELLLAAIELRVEDAEAARGYCSSALARLLNVDSPAIYQAYFMLGQTEEMDGNTELARQAYKKAYHKLEDLRLSLGREELKIAFLKNKLATYEGLVVTSLAVDAGRRGHCNAFEYIEQAKSRSLADLIAFRASTLGQRTAEHSAATGQFRELKQKLNWVYHHIELEELNPAKDNSYRLVTLRKQSREYEGALVKAFSQLKSADHDFAGLESGKTISAEELQAKLPPDAMVVEYYAARGTFYAAVINKKSIQVVPVADVKKVRELLRLLQLQLAKFRLGDEYIQNQRQQLLRATQSHLAELYGQLVAPIRKHLDTAHVVFVPHGFLHYLPFHALGEGKDCLIDEFSVSYAPSASIFALCQDKVVSGYEDQALVMAVPDTRAPHIAEEARFVAEALGNANVFLGEAATEECLRKYGPTSRYVHIATHGYFREDNPMFSSIRLGSSLLSLFDLYQLQFNAELVTLSGCGTGMNMVIGGDELIGLVRGLLYAGAQTLMVSLWEIHDKSAAEFMREFYGSYKLFKNKAVAVKKAMQSTREKYPHPYHWAAFSLIGKFS